MYVTAVPAFGRDYKTAKEVKADWEANKDFRINDMSHPHDGAYINKADAKGLTVNIRYKKLTQICTVKG